MLNDKLQLFYQTVHAAMMEVGNSAPRIADRVMAEAFPDTSEAARREGADRMLRDGVIAFITNYLKRNANAPLMLAQIDMSEISEDYRPIVAKLHGTSHYVPALQQHMPVKFLIAHPAHLDEARKYKRLKGDETIAEAEVLDELYAAVMDARVR